MKITTTDLVEMIWYKRCPDYYGLKKSGCFGESQEKPCVECWKNALEGVDVIEVDNG